MKNQVTTIEQSRRLLELGIPAEKASMAWIDRDQVHTLDFRGSVNYEIYPAYTVADLLGMMPMRIDAKDADGDICFLYLNMSRGEENWEVYYNDALGMCELVRLCGNSLIDCFIAAIEWIVSNGYELKA